MQITFLILIAIYSVYALYTYLNVTYHAVRLDDAGFALMKMKLILEGKILTNDEIKSFKNGIYASVFKGLFVRAVIVSVLVWLVIRFV